MLAKGLVIGNKLTSKYWLVVSDAAYERKHARKHGVVAIKAVAHKLARACYHMLHEGTTFNPTRAFG